MKIAFKHRLAFCTSFTLFVGKTGIALVLFCSAVVFGTSGNRKVTGMVVLSQMRSKVFFFVQWSINVWRMTL